MTIRVLSFNIIANVYLLRFRTRIVWFFFVNKISMIGKSIQNEGIVLGFLMLISVMIVILEVHIHYFWSNL